MKKITDQQIQEITENLLNEIVIKIQETQDPKGEYALGDIWGLYCSHDWDELIAHVSEYMITKKSEIDLSYFKNPRS